MIKQRLLLNGLAIIGVVLSHASGWGYTAMFWWADRYRSVSVPDFEALGSLSYYSLRVVEQLVIFSVPAFLFLSGFFIASATGRKHTTISWQLVAGRVRFLLAPYLFWSAVVIAGRLIQSEPTTVSDVVVSIVTGRVAAGYYFVPLLIQLYLLSPFLIPLVKRNWLLVLGLATVLQLSVRIMLYLQLVSTTVELPAPLGLFSASWLFPGHILWFVSGIVSSFHLDSFRRWLQRARWYLLGTLLILLPLGVLEWEWLLRASGQNWLAPRETVLDSVFAATFIFCFLSFRNLRLPFSNTIVEVGKRSFGIYLVHIPVLEYSARAIYHLAPGLLAHQFLLQPFLWAMGLGVPILLMRAASAEWSPARKSYRYIFG